MISLPRKRTVFLGMSTALLAYGTYKGYRRLRRSIKDKEYVLDQVADVVFDILSTEGGGRISAGDVVLGGTLLKHYKCFEDRPVIAESKRIHDKATLEKGLRHMRYASATYGWMLINKVFFKHKSLFPSYDNENEEETPDLNTQVLSLHTGIPVSDLKKVQWNSEDAFSPAHYLAVDRAHKTIVVAVRGTMDVADVINDLVCTYTSYGKGETHQGFLKCASGVFENVHDDVLELTNEFPDYEVSIVGHSLGAAAAVILTCMLEEAHPELPLHCYAYGPPGIFDFNTASEQKMKTLVTSYICGDDIISRMSLGHFREMKNAAAWFMQQLPSDQSVLMHLIKEKIRPNVSSPDIESLFKTHTIDTSKLQYMESKKLFPVGTLNYIQLHSPTDNENDTIEEEIFEEESWITTKYWKEAKRWMNKAYRIVTVSVGVGVSDGIDKVHREGVREGVTSSVATGAAVGVGTAIRGGLGDQGDDSVRIGSVDTEVFSHMVLSRNIIAHHFPWSYEEAFLSAIDQVEDEKAASKVDA